jgi:ribosomal protein S27E
MQKVSCPGCGAPVEFKSHASVMAVCGYCNTTVLKSADEVKDYGKMSSVLEDYTPIQLGTSGVAGGRSFTVIGRIQLRYDAGMWNEWFLMFDNGSEGWLGDASGQFTLSTLRAPPAAIPEFDDVQVGKQYGLGGRTAFTAADKRTATCVGGEGELPFVVGEGWEARVVDFRAGSEFVTIDYSDEKPAVYTGTAITLEGMKAQLLRDADAIKESAGKFRGKLDSLECPACGTAIKYVPGMATKVCCPSCATQLDAASPKIDVLTKGEKLERVRLTLPIGSSGKINGIDYSVIGAMVLADEEGSEWTEYLLYNTRSQFNWLVETEEGWWRSAVMDSWPEFRSLEDSHVSHDKVDFERLYDYEATVRFAAGAFNWRVAVGDHTHIHEFERGNTRLAAEWTPQEVTWSRSTSLAFDQVAAWFGKNVRGEMQRATAPVAKSGNGITLFLWAILGLNIIPVLMNFGSIIYPLVAALAIWAPAKLFGAGSNESKK